VSNKDTIIEALTMQLKIEREGNLALAKRAKREWVGLTDEELKQAYLEVSGNEWCLGGISNAESFYDAIEAKLKEKNT
jgi:hypothetical protein